MQAKRYFPSNTSIIAVQRLNFFVRNGERCDPLTKSPEQKTQMSFVDLFIYLVELTGLEPVPSNFMSGGRFIAVNGT